MNNAIKTQTDLSQTADETTSLDEAPLTEGQREFAILLGRLLAEMWKNRTQDLPVLNQERKKSRTNLKAESRP